MALLLWILRVLVLLLIARFLVTMVRQAIRYAGGSSSSPGPVRGRKPERIGGTLVQDPQCGTYIPQDRAIAHTSGGATIYFCSTTCRDAWMQGTAASRARS